MRALITAAVMSVAGTTAFVAALLRRVISRIRHDRAMMVPMAVGMMAGMAVGGALGTLFPDDLWPPTVMGSATGMAAGLLVGLPTGAMGVLEGITAGLMGGTMGAMMGGMMPSRGVPLIVSGLAFVATVSGLTVKILMEKGNGGHHGQPGESASWGTALWWAGLAAILTGIGAWLLLGTALDRFGPGNAHQHEPPLEITVRAEEFRFSSTVQEVRAGRPVRLLFENSGEQEHDLTIPGMPYGRIENGIPGQRRLGLHLSAAAGQSAIFDFVPYATGDYTAFCSVPGHRDAGMQYVLRVRPDGQVRALTPQQHPG